MSDDLSGAGITAKERLANIERILTDIKTDLSGKADLALVVAIDTRLKDMELWRAELRATQIQQAADEARKDREFNTVKNDQEKQRRTVWYATGAVAALVVAAQLFVPLLIK